MIGTVLKDIRRDQQGLGFRTACSVAIWQPGVPDFTGGVTLLTQASYNHFGMSADAPKEVQFEFALTGASQPLR
jgi:hypothetical protein